MIQHEQGKKTQKSIRALSLSFQTQNLFGCDRFFFFLQRKNITRYSSVHLLLAIWITTRLAAETVVGQCDSESGQIGIWKALYLLDRLLVPDQPNS